MKNNIFATYPKVNIINIFSYNIMICMSNIILNNNHSIKYFGLCLDFSSFEIIFIMILSKLLILILKIRLEFRLFI